MQSVSGETQSYLIYVTRVLKMSRRTFMLIGLKLWAFERYLCFLLFQIIMMSSFVSYAPLQYETADIQYVYPYYANVLGWCITFASISLIPGYALYKLYVTPGETFMEVRPSFIKTIDCISKISYSR